MSEQLSELINRIRDELGEIEQAVQRAQSAWQYFQQSSNDLYLDSVALNLHGFYNGVELLFEEIAETVDGIRPEGREWHQALLAQMASELPEVRSAVISQASRISLDDYRRFRHVVRHTYAARFDSARLMPLIKAAPHVFNQVRSELLAFSAFLENQA